MIQYKCPSCGGEMHLGASGALECPYCGTKSFLSEGDLKANAAFRKQVMLNLTAQAKEKENNFDEDTIWICAGEETYAMRDGNPLTIRYMKKYTGDGMDCYLAQKSVVYVFANGAEAEKFLAGYQLLTFPEADAKLHRSFPELQMRTGLSDGREVLVFRRNPHFYPAEMIAPMPSVHLAWVISRMENICCALEYAGLVHGGLTPNTVWINPVTHEGALFGDWRQVRQVRGTEDLVALRRTALALGEDTSEPKQLSDFLHSAPTSDAFADFSQWDTVIETGFGGHKFATMEGFGG